MWQNHLVKHLSLFHFRFPLGFFFPFYFAYQGKFDTKHRYTKDSWKTDHLMSFTKLHHSAVILLLHPIWLQEFLKRGFFKATERLNVYKNQQTDTNSQYWAHAMNQQHVAAFTQAVLLKQYLVHHIRVLCWYIKWHIKIRYGMFCDWLMFSICTSMRL